MSTAYKLGAIELIELGRPRLGDDDSRSGLPVLRKPFLGSNLMSAPLARRLGTLDFDADISTFIDTQLDLAVQALIEATGENSASTAFADALALRLMAAPDLDVLAFEVLLLAKAALQWNVVVPTLASEDIANLFVQVKSAADTFITLAEKKSAQENAAHRILSAAELKGGIELRAAITAVLRGNTPEDTAGVPEPQAVLPEGADEIGRFGNTGESPLVTIGLPIIGATGLVFLALA